MSYATASVMSVRAAFRRFTPCLANVSAGRSQAVQQLEKLLQALSEVGLQTEIRQGDGSSLLIFVRASKKGLRRAVYRSR
jgi:hypothetical protein